MKNIKSSASQDDILTKAEINTLYFDDPKSEIIERELNDTKMQYFYFDSDLKIKTKTNELLNGCLLSGNAILNYDEASYDISQFDIFFLPAEKELTIKIDLNYSNNYKICLYYCPYDKKVEADFEIQHYDPEKFLPRGEYGSNKKMATFRTVWTAIKNNYFMSGFTNIPMESLKQGVITSVNLEKNEKGDIEIYPHIHPEYPEVYIMCIDDKDYAITQYLINIKGNSVCRDLSNGDGLYFPGSLGHSNFCRPFYRELNYCMYYWCIPTFGKTEIVNPITIKV